MGHGELENLPTYRPPPLLPPRPERFEDEDEEESEDLVLSSAADLEPLRCEADDGVALRGAASRLESDAELPRLAEGGVAVLEPRGSVVLGSETRR